MATIQSTYFKRLNPFGTGKVFKPKLISGKPAKDSLNPFGTGKVFKLEKNKKDGEGERS